MAGSRPTSATAADRAWPGYGLGDAIVTRDHLGALDPVDRQGARVEPGLRLVRGQQGHAGDAARPLRRRRRHHAGRLQRRSGCVLRLQQHPGRQARTRRRSSTRSRVGSSRRTRSSWSTAPRPRRAASSASSSSVQDRDTNRYLQDDLTTWGAANTINVNLASPNATSTDLVASTDDRGQPSAPAPGQDLRGQRQQRRHEGHQEDRDVRARRPDADHLGHRTVGQRHPDARPSPSPGTAQDDFGVNSITFSFRDSQNRYLQDDGYREHRPSTRSAVLPDVVGATNATWSYEVTAPVRGRVDDPGDRRRHGRSVRPAQRGPDLARERHRGPADGDDRARRR